MSENVISKTSRDEMQLNQISGSVSVIYPIIKFDGNTAVPIHLGNQKTHLNYLNHHDFCWPRTSICLHSVKNRGLLDFMNNVNRFNKLTSLSKGLDEQPWHHFT